MIKDKSIFIKNIYYMLSYAFTTLNQGGYEDVATEEFENMHNLFAAILAKGIGRQLKQGLYREYLNREEDVAVVRGKIDMPGTIQNRLARKRVLTCEYDELSENNLLNQILKTTVMLLLRHARVDQDYKNDLKKEMLFFSNVDTIDPASIRWSAIRFQRNNNTYRMLISLCQLVLEGMLLTTDCRRIQAGFLCGRAADEPSVREVHSRILRKGMPTGKSNGLTNPVGLGRWRWDHAAGDAERHHAHAEVTGF